MNKLEPIDALRNEAKLSKAEAARAVRLFMKERADYQRTFELEGSCEEFQKGSE